MSKIETISTEPLVKKIVDEEGSQILVNFGKNKEEDFGDYEKKVIETLSKRCAIDSFGTVRGYESTKNRKMGRVVDFKISKEGESDWFGWGTLSRKDNDIPKLRLHYAML